MSKDLLGTVKQWYVKQAALLVQAVLVMNVQHWYTV